jgi:hypothetical protein
MRSPPVTQQQGVAASTALGGAGTSFRVAELAGLFVLLPLLVRWGAVTLPRLVVLGLVTAGCIVLLWRDPAFERRRLFSFGDVRGSLVGTAVRGIAAAGTLLALVLAFRPEALLAWPRKDPALWLAGIAIYPFLSAWPQEVVYRVFFFHRYRALFADPRALVAANAVAFGMLHTVYPNPVAPILSLPAGLLLALTYRRTRSLGSVWLEHSIYGLLLFTIGLGEYFYDGRP